MSDEHIIRDYANLYESRKLWQKMLWRGRKCWKTPEDMWLYAETLWELQPQLIVEFGTGPGGTAVFLADVLALIGDPQSRVITVDRKTPEDEIVHPRVTQLVGEILDPDVVRLVKEAARSVTGPVLCIEDSEHVDRYTLSELELYHDIVTEGSYFVIEDLGWPEEHRDMLGAVEQFLSLHPEFTVDASKSKYMLTLAPGGWLKRGE